MSDLAAAIRELAAAVRGPVRERVDPPRDPVRRYDALGRKEPVRLDWWSFARGIPGFSARFDREVPPEFVAQVDDEETEVACPCGETPRLEPFLPAVCGCGRVFVDMVRRVMVAPRAEDVDAA